jgi:hypothetical protein
MHFCHHLCTLRKTSQSITHPKITPGQARLTLEFFAGRLPEKKVYLDGTSILSILLSLEPGCHNAPPLRRPTSSSVNLKPGTSPLGHFYTSSTVICVSYVHIAAYVSYCVPPIGPTHHAYVPTSLTHMPPYPSQLTRTCP